jgi:hypothetical protein
MSDEKKKPLRGSRSYGPKVVMVLKGCGPKGYFEHVMQADRGCDLDFLAGSSGSIVDRESH